MAGYGNFDSLHDASEFVSVIEKGRGSRSDVLRKLHSEINSSTKKTIETAVKYGKSGYGQYLKQLVGQ